MSDVRSFSPGGYRFINAVFQYSGGVAAEPGYEIVRARLAKPLPWAEGLALAEAHIAAQGRPASAFCACEMRSPSPFSETGFIDFNRGYVEVLERWGIFKDEVNPVARTNVCPEHRPPTEVLLFAFSYTVEKTQERPSFVIAGGGEAREIDGSFKDQIVAYEDRSATGMAQKARYVAAEMRRRLNALGFDWQDALAVNAYTVFDIGSVFEEVLVAPGAVESGLNWCFCRPPVVGLDFEMDLRAPAREILL